MEIKPAYVTFEQAKLLEEKGANLSTSYNEHCGETEYYHKETGEVKLYSYFNSFENMIPIPQQWQVVEWLRIKHNIFINVKRSTRFKDGKSLVYYYGVAHTEHTEQFDYDGYETPQEAISSVIDYVFKNLI
jgi:predicted metalloendopeptidase